MAFDSSDYRANTYGTPDFYCDCTRSLASNGTGVLGDEYNLTQAMAVAGGSVVGFIPVSAGTPVQMAAPSASGYSEIPAFQPANSGTLVNPTVFVTKYAAVTLTLATIGSNGNRTELRHAGTATVAAGPTESGTGGACYGAHTRSYIIYDGFYTDMAQAEIRSDAGHLAAQACTGVKFLNFVVKGTTTNCQSNAVIYRPENAVDTVLSNFYAYDFSNDPFSPGVSDVPQAGLFSDQYGDQNFLIEHFDIDNMDMGIFCKGTSGGLFNYGTIQYGVVRNSSSFFRFNDMDTTNMSYLKYCLAYNSIGARPKALSPDGIVFDIITSQPRNLTIDHVTVAKIDSTDGNLQAALYTDPGGFNFGSGISITNSIFDMDSGSNGHEISFTAALPDTLNYNFYYKNGSTETYVFNGTQYNTFSDWKTAVQAVNAALETGSIEGTSVPFLDRTNDDYHVSGGHAAKTGSSTGGEIGCYATSEVIGVDIGVASPVADALRQIISMRMMGCC